MSALPNLQLIDPDIVLEHPSYGRIEPYSHSDTITQNKGGALVRVICDSEAGSRTQLFVQFAKSVAKFAYATSATCWGDIVETFPDMIKELNDLRIALGEDVKVTKIVVMKL